MNRAAILVFILALTGCERSQTLTDQVPEISIELRDKAIAAKKDLFNNLSARLIEVMQTKGPEAAIEVCSTEASQISEDVGKSHGVRIGRTALKLRNSKNTAPDWAVELLSENTTDPQFVTIDNDTAGALLPIRLKNTCLTCHGPADSIKSSLKEELAKFYPNDTATGFNEGDLRGWFWVEVPKAELSNGE